MSDSAKYNILGIGNAIVDVTIRVDEDFIEKKGLKKGSMSLIDKDDAMTFSNIKYDKICSGGSVANSMVMIANLGDLKCAFAGKVGDGRYADIFTKELFKCSSEFITRVKDDITGRSFILVTPDGQRTMKTYLGASIKLNEIDIDHKVIFASNIVFIEGYLFDVKTIKAACVRAIDVAQAYNEPKVALTLSDAGCVHRHKEEFLDLVENGKVHLLFANLEEIQTLFGESFEKVLKALTKDHDLKVIVTKSENGAIGFFQGNEFEVKTKPVENPVDTTGAGDAFAAGFLYSYSKKKPFKTCLENGNIVAFNVVNTLGARFQNGAQIKLS